MLRLFRACALLVLILQCTPENGFAFFPSIEDVEARLRKATGQVQSLQAVFTFPDQDPSVQLRVWQSSDMWRQEWVVEEEETPLLRAAAIGQGQKLLASFPRGAGFTVPPFWFWKQPDPYIWWSRLGIEPGVMSYQFLEGRPCLVLGAVYGQADTPQMWIDTELFVPLRVRSRQGYQLDWLEYRTVANHDLPHRTRMANLQWNATSALIQWKGVNTSHPANLYDVDTFNRRFSGVQDDDQLPLLFFRLREMLPNARP